MGNANAKTVVDPHTATSLTQPGGGYVEVPANAAPSKAPHYTFHNRSNTLQKLQITPDRTFTFGPVGTWCTDDLELGKLIAEVADKHGIEVVSKPNEKRPKDSVATPEVVDLVVTVKPPIDTIQVIQVEPKVYTGQKPEVVTTLKVPVPTGIQVPTPEPESTHIDQPTDLPDGITKIQKMQRDLPKLTKIYQPPILPPGGVRTIQRMQHDPPKPTQIIQKPEANVRVTPDMVGQETSNVSAQEAGRANAKAQEAAHKDEEAHEQKTSTDPEVAHRQSIAQQEKLHKEEAAKFETRHKEKIAGEEAAHKREAQLKQEIVRKQAAVRREDATVAAERKQAAPAPAATRPASTTVVAPATIQVVNSQTKTEAVPASHPKAK